MSRLIIRALCLICGWVVMFTQVSAQKSPYTYRRDRLGKFNLGMTMGLARNTYRMGTQIGVTDNGTTVERVDILPLPGLMLGVISNFNVADFLSLRMVPHFTFEQRNFAFYFHGAAAPTIKSVESSYFNLPFTAQWRTPYYHRYRIMVSTGVQTGWNMISDRRVRNDPNLLKIKGQDFGFTLSAGFIIYGERIKLTPEIRYMGGIVNLYEPAYTSHATAISRLKSQTLTFCLSFE